MRLLGGESDIASNATIIVQSTITVNSHESWKPNRPLNLQRDFKIGEMVKIESRKSLSLENIILDGINLEDVSGSLISVHENSILNIDNGVILCNNKNNRDETGTIVPISNGIGGGVFINRGTFNMSGEAVISSNKAISVAIISGAGVYIELGSTFNMSGKALITNNTALKGGGVRISSSQFSMSENAVISGNIAQGGGGVHMSGSYSIGGAIIVPSRFDMSGNAVNYWQRLFWCARHPSRGW